MNELQTELGAPGTEYKGKRGEICACYDQGLRLWHRAKIEGIKLDRADVFYIDFGNVIF